MNSVLHATPDLTYKMCRTCELFVDFRENNYLIFYLCKKETIGSERQEKTKHHRRRWLQFLRFLSLYF